MLTIFKAKIRDCISFAGDTDWKCIFEKNITELKIVVWGISLQPLVLRKQGFMGY